jgi:hypothetical protein
LKGMEYGEALRTSDSIGSPDEELHATACRMLRSADNMKSDIPMEKANENMKELRALCSNDNPQIDLVQTSETAMVYGQVLTYYELHRRSAACKELQYADKVKPPYFPVDTVNWKRMIEVRNYCRKHYK